MKKILAALILFGVVSQSFAGVCRDTFLEKKEIRSLIGAGFTGSSGLGALMMIGGTAAFPALPFIAVGTTVAGGVYWVLATRKPARLVKLIDEAQGCKGKLISKSYESYKDSHDANSQVSKKEFSEEIVRSDLDGSLSPVGSVPSVKEFGLDSIK